MSLQQLKDTGTQKRKPNSLNIRYVRSIQMLNKLLCEDLGYIKNHKVFARKRSYVYLTKMLSEMSHQ